MKLTNAKAYHDYEILQKYEAGVMLTGAEAKAVRAGRLQLGGSYVKIRDNEAWLVNVIIHPYQHSKIEDFHMDRTRKLLLKRSELDQLNQKIQTKGVTLIPVSLYTRGSLVKVEVALAKGKKQFEKRATIKKRDLDRELQRRQRPK